MGIRVDMVKNDMFVLSLSLGLNRELLLPCCDFGERFGFKG